MRVKGCLIVVLICVFLLISDVRNFFSWTYWPFVDLLWRNVYSSPLPILKVGFWLFVVALLEFLNIFWILNPYQICKYFLPFCGLSFHFFGSVCFVLKNIFPNERE